MRRATELQVYQGFDPYRVADQFNQSGLRPEIVKVSNMGLIVPDSGAAVECFDGRFGELADRKKHGPKLPGGYNCIPALKTGGDVIGFNVGARQLTELGYRPGTHKRCAFFELWLEQALESATHPLKLPIQYFEACGYNLGRWIQLRNKGWGGKHFTLSGEHAEKDAIFNPFIDTTTEAQVDQFGGDMWVLKLLGIPERRAIPMFAETVIKASHVARTVRILTP